MSLKAFYNACVLVRIFFNFFIFKSTLKGEPYVKRNRFRTRR